MGKCEKTIIDYRAERCQTNEIQCFRCLVAGTLNRVIFVLFLQGIEGVWVYVERVGEVHHKTNALRLSWKSCTGWIRRGNAESSCKVSYWTNPRPR